MARCARSSSVRASDQPRSCWQRSGPAEPMGELLIAVSAGVGATITPCVLPLYPGFIAYVTGRPPVTSASSAVAQPVSRPSPAVAAMLVWLGVVVGMIAIGAVLALLSVSLGSVLRVAVPLIDLVLIGLGIALLLGANPF